MPAPQARAQRLSVSDFPGWTDDRFTPNSLRGVTPGSGRGDRCAFVLTSHGRETDHDADARRVRRAGVRMARGASRPQTCRSRVCQGRRGGVGGGGHCHRPSGKPRWAGTVRCSAPRLLPAPPPRYLSASPGPVSLSHHLLLEFCRPISTSKLRRSCLFIVRLLSVHYYLFEEIISFPLFSLV